MSTRKTTAERIVEQKAKMEQYSNEMKRLVNLQKAEERKKRNHRICTRGAHMESLLPDTIGLSDARFFAFLEKTVANDFGRRSLAAFVAEQKKEDAADTTNEAAVYGGTPKLNNGGNGVPKSAPTAVSPSGVDKRRPENIAKSAS